MIFKQSLLLVLFLFGQSIVLADQEVVIYGDSNYPPYSFEEDSQPNGIYVDILKSAFAKIPGCEVTIEMIPWKRGLTYVRVGEALALFPPYHAEERVPWMLFSEPILEEQVVVFGKSENLKGRTRWPEDFFGFNLGMNRGFNLTALGGEKFAEACESGKIALQEANSSELNLLKLEADRIEFYLNEKLTNISSHPSIKRGIVVSANYGHLGFTRRSENFPFLTDFKNKFDVVIKNMKASKEIDKIVEKYLD